MKNWSLRRKLQIFTGAVVAGVLLVFGLGVAINLYHEQVEVLDQRVSQEALPLIKRIAASNQPALWLESSEGRQFFEMFPHDFVHVQDPSGKVLYESLELRDQLIPSLGTREGFRNVRMDDEFMRLGVFEKNGFLLLIMTDLEDVYELVADLMLAYLLALPLAVLAAAFGAWWIAERAFAPIAEIAATAEEVTAQHLDKRLPESLADDDVARLSRILNQMFDRLERSFHSANRFSADASHELKTPLTIMRGRIEEALQQRNADPATEMLLVDILEETSRLSTITENLLLLAKADAWQLEIKPIAVNFNSLIEEVLEDIGILASARGIHLDHNLQSGLIVHADAGRLRQVLLNLLDNAVKYGEADGKINVSLRAKGSEAVCSITNSGTAIPADKASQIFDRFYQGDPSRSDSERGYGLGLSICLELIRAHGGRLELAENQPGHIEFRFFLPLVIQ